MEQLIRFYESYGQFLDGFFIYIRIVVVVIIGAVVRNIWDERVSVRGSKFLSGTLFLSLLLYYTPLLKGKYLYFVSLIFGFGMSNLIVSWKKGKIWNLYDFVNKVQTFQKEKDNSNTSRKKSSTKNNRNNQETQTEEQEENEEE